MYRTGDLPSRYGDVALVMCSTSPFRFKFLGVPVLDESIIALDSQGWPVWLRS